MRSVLNPEELLLLLQMLQSVTHNGADFAGVRFA